MIEKIILLMFLTFLPFFELRLSIPMGILKESVSLPFGYSLQGFGLPWPIVFFSAVFANIALGPTIYLALHKLVDFVIQFRPIGAIYRHVVLRTQKRAKPYVEKYGLIGLALFIAIPLPGSGSWTGALAAYLFGVPSKKFFLANLFGVVIAGIIVTAATLGIFSFLNI